MAAKTVKAEIDGMYRQASGSATVRGAVSWAAERLGVTRKTVERWRAGETRPTSAQLNRLRAIAGIEARAQRIRADRVAGRGVWRRLAAWLRRDSLEEEVTAAAERRAEERAAAQTRANQALNPPRRRSWLRSRSRPW